MSADTGTMSATRAASPIAAMRGSSAVLSTRSILLRTRTSGTRHVVDQVPHVAVAGALGLGDVDDQGDDVDLAQRRHRHVDHPDVEAVQRPVDARGVEVDDLAVGVG